MIFFPKKIVCSQAGANSSSGGGGGTGINTVTPDLGGAIAPDGAGNINLISNVAALNCGSSVDFTGISNTITLNVTDALNNVLVGLDAGNATLTGTDNTGLGRNVGNNLTSGVVNSALGINALESLTTGNRNAAFGGSAIDSITTGSYNVGIGDYAGYNWVSSESNNVCINASSTTVVGESNVLRIGNGTGAGQQQLNQAYICGINGTTGTGTAVGVTSGNQLTAGGILTNSSQPSFSVYNSTNPANVTGDGTVYTNVYDTELFDRGSNFASSTFTAPVTGIYYFSYTCSALGLGAAHTLGLGQLVTTANTFNASYMNYSSTVGAAAANGVYQASSSWLVPMTAGDTAVTTFAVSNSTKTVGQYGGAVNGSFSGFLVC